MDWGRGPRERGWKRSEPAARIARGLPPEPKPTHTRVAGQGDLSALPVREPPPASPQTAKGFEPPGPDP